jgi:hypothetical protein
LSCCDREGPEIVTTLLLVHVVLAAVALLVVGFVAYPYRGRAVPRAERLTEKLAEVADRVDPGDAPPLGVLTTPEKSRAMSARFERAEETVRRGARLLAPTGRR